MTFEDGAQELARDRLRRPIVEGLWKRRRETKTPRSWRGVSDHPSVCPAPFFARGPPRRGAFLAAPPAPATRLALAAGALGSLALTFGSAAAFARPRPRLDRGSVSSEGGGPPLALAGALATDGRAGSPVSTTPMFKS